MPLKRSILHLIVLLSVYAHAYSMKNEQSFYTGFCKQHKVQPLKLMVALFLVDKETSYITDSTLPDNLKVYLLDMKNKLCIEGFFQAVKQGNKKDVKFILKHGPEKGITINIRNNEGDTPLIIAVRHDQLAMAEFLLARGALVSVKNNYGRAAIHEAIALQKPHLVKLFSNNPIALDLLNSVEQKKAAMLIANEAQKNAFLQIEQCFRLLKMDPISQSRALGNDLLADLMEARGIVTDDFHQYMIEKDRLRKSCAHCDVECCKYKCSKCKLVYYCSKECQQQNWRIHRRACKN